MLCICNRGSAWLRSLHLSPSAARLSSWYGKRCLIILNPISGGGNSRRWCHTLVKPVLEAHDMHVTVLETKSAGHAGQFLREYAALQNQFDLLISISGDGLLNEILNALVARAMPSPSEPQPDPASTQFHSLLRDALHSLPIAILPGGTSNGLVASLYGPKSDVVDVLRKIMSSDPRSTDIMSVEAPYTGEDSLTQDHITSQYVAHPVRVDILTYLYGLVADNDHFAERTFRNWPFAIRTTLAPLLAIALARTYSADVRIKPLPVSEEERKKWHLSDPTPLQDWEGNGTSRDGKWKQWRGSDWSSVVAMNVSWPAHDVLFAPSALPDDGAIYFCAVRNAMSRFKLLNIFLSVDTGAHNALPQCDYFKCEAICVHPRKPNGNMCISGEKLPIQATMIRVQHKAACFVY
jgi:sphingosine kinase